MINSIKNYINKNILKDADEKLKIIQISSSSGKDFSKGRIILIVFRHNDSKPFLVCKFAKDRNYEDTIINEYEKTKELFESFPDIIPRPYCAEKIEDRTVFIQEFTEGKTISNLMYAFRNSKIYNQDEFIKTNIKYIDDVYAILQRFNSSNILSDYETFKNEVISIKSEFEINFKLNSYERLVLEKSIEEFIKLFEYKKIYKRLIHLDFTPFNVINNMEKYYVIDFEFCENSTLGIFELFRYIYYTYKDLYDLDVKRYTSDMEYSFYLFLSDLEHPLFQKFNDMLSKIYDISINRNNRKLLCMVFYMLHYNMQYRMKSYVSDKFIKECKRYVNYFSGVYQSDEVFEYENSLVTELNHFLNLKDMQINSCEEALERYEKEIEKNKKEIEELKKEMLKNEKEIINIKSTKTWRALEKIKTINSKK